MADARKNTLLYHFTAMNVVRAILNIQNIVKCKPLEHIDNIPTYKDWFSSEEIHKVL